MIKYLKRLKTAAILTIILFGCILIISLFNLFNILGGTFTSILNLIFTILFFVLLGISSGKNASKRGFLAGLRTGLIAVVIIFCLSMIIFGFKFSLNLVIYYAILIISCVLGAMIGINKKAPDA